jgi:hypothetical protein
MDLLVWRGGQHPASVMMHLDGDAISVGLVLVSSGSLNTFGVHETGPPIHTGSVLSYLPSRIKCRRIRPNSSPPMPPMRPSSGTWSHDPWRFSGKAERVAGHPLSLICRNFILANIPDLDSKKQQMHLMRRPRTQEGAAARPPRRSGHFNVTN